MSARAIVVALAVLLLLPVAGWAQESNFYTWVNFLKAKPGQGEALVQLMIVEDSQVLDALIDSGAAAEWGIGMPIIHDGDDPTSHVQWITFNGWAGADAFMAKFMELQGTRSDEEKKAMAEKWQSMVVPGSHADTIHESIHVGQGGDERPAYIVISYYTAKWGKSSDAKSMYEEVAAPVYDQLVADGKIINYGLFVPEIHRGESWTHMGWYTASSLAARDVVAQAFNAADEARSEEENADLTERWLDIFEPGAHTDQILMVVHYKGPSGGE